MLVDRFPWTDADVAHRARRDDVVEVPQSVADRGVALDALVVTADPVTNSNTAQHAAPAVRDPAGRLRTAAAMPTPAPGDIVGGRGAAAGAVILRVPAGRTWRGSVHLAAVAHAAIGDAAAIRTCRLDLAGAGVTPAAGIFLELPLALAVTAATATQGSNDRAGTTMPGVVIVAGGAEATLTLNGDATQMRASARGELIA